MTKIWRDAGVARSAGVRCIRSGKGEQSDMKWKLTEFGRQWENTELLDFLEKHGDITGIGVPKILIGHTFIIQGTGVGAFYPMTETEIRYTKTWVLADSDPVVAVMEHETGDPEPDPFQAAMALVVTHYWEQGKEHTPYSWNLRTPDNDMEMDKSDLLASMIKHSGAQDGDEIEIIVRKTGRRPFGDRKFVRVGPHEYRREKA